MRAPAVESEMYHSFSVLNLSLVLHLHHMQAYSLEAGLTHIVIDNLHLLLRVCDKLITFLVSELQRQDKIDRQKNPVKYKHCDEYQKFVTSLGILNFEFYIGKTRELKTQSLTGPEKLKVFHNIKIEAVFPNSNPAE